MPDYSPTSRRPIAARFRRTGEAATRFCVRRRIHADAISLCSIVPALAAAICFVQAGKQPWLLIVAPLLCYLRLWFNMLDGMVAVAAAQASRRGEILNDLPDRVSDVIIFVGVAHSGLMNPIIGYWAAIFALLTAYVGLFGQAVGGHREFGGIMSKPWRMVALGVGAWAQFAMARADLVPPIVGNLSVLDWSCLVVIAGCVQTMVVRLNRITATLQDRPR